MKLYLAELLCTKLISSRLDYLVHYYIGEYFFSAFKGKNKVFKTFTLFATECNKQLNGPKKIKGFCTIYSAVVT